MVVGFLTPQRNAMTLAAKDFVRPIFFPISEETSRFILEEQSPKVAWFKNDAFQNRLFPETNQAQQPSLLGWKPLKNHGFLGWKVSVFQLSFLGSPKSKSSQQHQYSLQ